MSEETAAFGTGMAVGLACGIAIASMWSTSCWKEDAIDRGFAEYNQTTGQWQWKTNCVEIAK